MKVIREVRHQEDGNDAKRGYTVGDAQRRGRRKPAAYDKALRVERHDATPALGLRKSPKPGDGLFQLPTGPGLGLQINEAELAKRRVPIA